MSQRESSRRQIIAINGICETDTSAAPTARPIRQSGQYALVAAIRGWRTIGS
jgi:hypothetical protein